MKQQNRRISHAIPNARPAPLQVTTSSTMLQAQASRPTIEAMVPDQLLEADLLDMLDEFERHVALMEK